jgi:magnesium-transporting ATPase (P-type)
LNLEPIRPVPQTDTPLPPDTTEPDRPWHTLSAEDALAALDSSPDGLKGEEPETRLERWGPNRVEGEKATPWWEVVLHQVRDPLIYILIAAAVAAVLVGEHIDAGVIAVVVLVNGIIGFVQEMKASRAMEALARMSAPRSVVLRGGEEEEVPTESLVPGDIVVLESGTRVPADLRILRVKELEVDESALTGESVPVPKDGEALDEEGLVPGDQSNMAFSGTTVTRGRGRGLVVRTGERSELGQIAEQMRQVGTVKTPIQEKVGRLARWIGLGVLGLTVIVAVVGLLRGMELQEILMTAVALAVAAIPEALPIILTVTLAVGVQRMAARHTIIRHLPAVETLGSTTVIASDKTGTLTRNEMTARVAWAAGDEYAISGAGYAADGEIELDGSPVDVAERRSLRLALLAGVLASERGSLPDPDDPSGDPTELAVLVAGAKGGVDPREARSESPELDMLPFESERQLMATLNETGEGRRIFIKGAPEAVLERCGRMLGADGEAVAVDESVVLDAARAMAERGYRVLATAYRDTDAESASEETIREGLVLAGLLGMEDPVRDEAVTAVQATRDAGIRVIMVTGDHATTATAIGDQLGLKTGEEGAVEGRRVGELSDEELDEVVTRTDVFARVAPEHKLRIVQSLRRHNQIIAVTGDGVNDAPALRAAHLGVAMGRSGTDVAREASDMVLTDDNFASITAAVEEGRRVFSNIRKVTYFLVSGSVGIVVAILLSLFAGLPLPFLAAQVLWINLVTNGLQDVALAFEPGEPGLLKERPRPVGEGVIHRPILARIAVIGGFLAAATLASFWLTMSATGGDLQAAQSVAMTQMVVLQFFHVYNCRSLHRSVFQVPLFANKFLFVSVVLAMLAQIAILHLPALQFVFRTTPLTAEQWMMVWGIGVMVIVVAEIDKIFIRRYGGLTRHEGSLRGGAGG